jgi:hypothetical protein
VPRLLWGQVVRCPACCCHLRASDQPELVQLAEPEPRVSAEVVKEQPEEAPPQSAGEISPERQPLPDLSDPELRLIRRDLKPHRGNLIMALGIVTLVIGVWGICIPLPVSLIVGIPAIVLATRDLRSMRMGSMDPHGEGLTRSGIIVATLGIAIPVLWWLAFIGLILSLALYELWQVWISLVQDWP